MQVNKESEVPHNCQTNGPAYPETLRNFQCKTNEVHSEILQNEKRPEQTSPLRLSEMFPQVRLACHAQTHRQLQLTVD